MGELQQQASDETNLLKLSNVSVRYGMETGSVTALDGVSLNVPSEGYTLGIVGESGSGKTTLGMTIMNVIEPPGKITSGTIDFRGRNILQMSNEELRNFRWQEISMIYQSAMNSLNPVKKSCDHIAEVIRAHGQLSKGEANQRALDLLAEVGIKKQRAQDYPHELSGGMRQRVVIAMALALSPRLLIADEPTSALDVVVQRQILSLLKLEVLRKKLSLIFITHEISILTGLVDNVAVMYSGEIVETGPIDDVLFEPLHPYTETLISTLLTFDSKLPSRTKASASGRRVNDDFGLGPATNSCKYVNQCKYAFERCKVERPILKKAGSGRAVACHKYN